jgi:hypothetical protein
MWFAWIAGKWGLIPGPFQKIIEYVGIVALVLWGFKVFWLNGHDNRIAAETRTQTTDQVLKQEEAKWKLETDTLKADKVDLQKQIDAAKVASDQLAKSRENIVARLATSLTQARTTQEGRRVQVNSIPASMLDGAIRDLSNELAKSSPSPAH